MSEAENLEKLRGHFVSARSVPSARSTYASRPACLTA